MITLVLGGARSGKSTYAERLAGRLPSPITYVATLQIGDDQDLSARVARHRSRRPDDWRTLEAGLDLPGAVRSLAGSILLDSLGPWVAAHGEDGTVDGAALCRALTERTGDSVVVSEEVGLGVHPSSAAGRQFRDALGTLNQDVAEVAEQVLLIVAGRALPLHRAPEMRAALAFLTPFPGARPPTPRALRWFPLVGLALGFALGGLWWATAKIWPLPVAAFIVVLADLGLTGMLHLDGLADTADGLLPHLSPERRLEVMREPTVGAFGMGAVVVVLLGRFAVFATLRPTPLLVAALWCLSRTAMAGVVDRVPYARRESGLPGAFMGSPVPVLGVAVVVLATAALAAAWKVPAGPVAVASSAVAFGAVVVWARHRIGGYTGDVLGAAGMVAETIGLLVAAARW